MAHNLTRAYIGVGSNINPGENIEKALVKLTKHVAVTGISTFHRTSPVGDSDQDDFMNGVFRIATSRTAGDLKFSVLRTIETELDRRRTEDARAPRTIDLDLLLWGELVSSEPRLRIPDPDIYTRPFIAFPLMELDPDLRLPDTGMFISDVTKTMSNNALQPDIPFSRKLQRSINI